MAHAKGTQVRQIMTPIQGTVAGFQVDNETGDVQLLVEWVGPDGETHSKYFREAEVEAV